MSEQGDSKEFVPHLPREVLQGFVDGYNQLDESQKFLLKIDPHNLHAGQVCEGSLSVPSEGKELEVPVRFTVTRPPRPLSRESRLDEMFAFTEHAGFLPAGLMLAIVVDKRGAGGIVAMLLPDADNG